MNSGPRPPRTFSMILPQGGTCLASDQKYARDGLNPSVYGGYRQTGSVASVAPDPACSALQTPPSHQAREEPPCATLSADSTRVSRRPRGILHVALWRAWWVGKIAWA